MKYSLGKNWPSPLLIILILALMLIAAPVQAGLFGSIKGWITSEVLAYAATAVIIILSGVFGVMFNRVSTTFKEAGEFLTVLGLALADSKISKEELAQIMKEGKDVFNLWAKTPVRYQVLKE